jgi:hypothetical protein
MPRELDKAKSPSQIGRDFIEIGDPNLRCLSFVDCDSSLVLWTFELDLTINECEDGEVSTDSHARTWVELGAALSDDDCARLHDFSAVLLNSASLTVTVSTVSS